MAQRAFEDDGVQCSTEDMGTDRGLTTSPMTKRPRTPLPKVQLCEYQIYVVLVYTSYTSNSDSLTHAIL